MTGDGVRTWRPGGLKTAYISPCLRASRSRPAAVGQCNGQLAMTSVSERRGAAVPTAGVVDECPTLASIEPIADRLDRGRRGVHRARCPVTACGFLTPPGSSGGATRFYRGRGYLLLLNAARTAPLNETKR